MSPIVVDSYVSRDDYLARDPAGERLWIYRDRRAQRWYLHGLFDRRRRVPVSLRAAP